MQAVQYESLIWQLHLVFPKRFMFFQVLLQRRCHSTCASCLTRAAMAWQYVAFLWPAPIERYGCCWNCRWQFGFGQLLHVGTAEQFAHSNGKKWNHHPADPAIVGFCVQHDWCLCSDRWTEQCKLWPKRPKFSKWLLGWDLWRWTWKTFAFRDIQFVPCQPLGHSTCYSRYNCIWPLQLCGVAWFKQKWVGAQAECYDWCFQTKFLSFNSQQQVVGLQFLGLDWCEPKAWMELEPWNTGTLLLGCKSWVI